MHSVNWVRVGECHRDPLRCGEWGCCWLKGHPCLGVMLDDDGLLTCIVYGDPAVRDNLVHWAWVPDIEDACTKFPWHPKQVETLDCGYNFICSFCGLSFKEHTEECDGD